MQFGSHGALELHGFARNRFWSIDTNPPTFPANSVTKTFVDLILKPSDKDTKIWPHRLLYADWLLQIFFLNKLYASYQYCVCLHFLFVSFFYCTPSMLGWTITVYFLSLQLWISSKSCSGSWRSSDTDITHKKHQYWWKTILIYICIPDLLFCLWHQVCQTNFAKFLICFFIIFYKSVSISSLIIWAFTILSNTEFLA